eukprot:2794730-Lingulodinium_polyedra.AAC.1
MERRTYPRPALRAVRGGRGAPPMAVPMLGCGAPRRSPRRQPGGAPQAAQRRPGPHWLAARRPRAARYGA